MSGTPFSLRRFRAVLIKEFIQMRRDRLTFAMMIGVPLARLCHHRVARIAWAAYPLLILFVIVATGNHFFSDAILGAATAGIGALVAEQTVGALGARSSLGTVSLRKRICSPLL